MDQKTFYTAWLALTIALQVGNYDTVKAIFMVFIADFSQAIAAKTNLVPSEVIAKFLLVIFNEINSSCLGIFINLFLTAMQYPPLNFNIRRNRNKMLTEFGEGDWEPIWIFIDEEEEKKKKKRKIRTFPKSYTVPRNQYTMHEHSDRFAKKMSQSSKSKTSKKRAAVPVTLSPSKRQCH